jgi:hypothetical protein
MLTWPIISAGKSNRPTFMAKAIANYGRDCALQRFAPQQTRHHRHLALDRIALRSGIDARGGACASYGRALRRPSGFSPASIVISKPPVAVQLPQPDVSANRDAPHSDAATKLIATLIYAYRD